MQAGGCKLLRGFCGGLMASEGVATGAPGAGCARKPFVVSVHGLGLLGWVGAWGIGGLMIIFDKSVLVVIGWARKVDV